MIFKGCQYPEMSSIPDNRHKIMMTRQVIGFLEVIFFLLAIMGMGAPSKSLACETDYKVDVSRRQLKKSLYDDPTQCPFP